MNRESYSEHISSMSHSHQVNIKIALDWFEKFCLGNNSRTMDTILADSIKLKYAEPQRHQVNFFKFLQKFIAYLGENEHDPATVRANFNLVKSYLNWYGFEIYTESVKAKLKFPKKIEEKAYPITLDDIKLIINNASPKRRPLYFFLSSTGMRIQETCKLRKRDLDFDNERVMVVIPGKYTKTKKPRETFITNETKAVLEELLKSKKDDDLIFGRNENSLKSKHLEEDYFYRLREKIGLTDRYDTGIHKITLHSFRSWFVTRCNRIDADFGNALAGHDKYMKKYDRLNESEMIELFIKAEPTLSIFDHSESQEDRQEIEELKKRQDETNIILKDLGDTVASQLNSKLDEGKELKHSDLELYAKMVRVQMSADPEFAKKMQVVIKEHGLT